MRQTLETFLRALRGSDIRISVAESLEAHRTAVLVGFRDRQVFKDAMSVVLAKSEGEKERFDTCFDAFFAVDAFEASLPGAVAPAEITEERPGPDGGGAGDSPLAAMLLEEDRPGLAAAMAAAANRAGVSEVRLFTQRGMYMRRILVEMGLRGLDDAIEDLAGGDAGAIARARRLERGRTALFEEARNVVERQIALFADPVSERLRQQFLMDARLSNIHPRDFDRVREIVRRLAKRLATRHSRRHRAAKRGRLDVRRTIRANLCYDGVPFERSWRHVRIDRPRVVAICDVSGSVAAAAQFLLLFLYSLNEVLADIHAFAFSSHLVDVSDTLSDQDLEAAIPAILERIGFRSTDYGRTLRDFAAGHLHLVDRQTTIVILGDARNNRGEAHVEIMRTLYDRSRRVIWLNPEPRGFWGTGDSEMLRYAPYCHQARVCNTIKHLERVVDQVLKVRR